jgi:hypothetical protein
MSKRPSFDDERRPVTTVEFPFRNIYAAEGSCDDPDPNKIIPQMVAWSQMLAWARHGFDFAAAGKKPAVVLLRFYLLRAEVKCEAVSPTAFARKYGFKRRAVDTQRKKLRMALASFVKPISKVASAQ